MSEIEKYDLDSLAELLADLDLKPSDVPLVWLGEVLIDRLKKPSSPTGTAQLGNTLLAVLKELKATPASRGDEPTPTNDALKKFKR